MLSEPTEMMTQLVINQNFPLKDIGYLDPRPLLTLHDIYITALFD